jgi:glyoxylase-like metal-dependent hydrolase (beta-lactamase superfamily II)
MRVRVITTGRVRGKRRTRGPLRYLGGGWSDETLPVHAFAAEHPAGVCLFDTGQTSRAAMPGYHPRWHPFLRLARFELEPDEEAATRLDPRSVRWVVLSHLHTDHVGGLAPFADAEVLVSRSEWERAEGFVGRLRGYVPQHWPRGLEPTLVDFAGPSAGPFPASHDVAGDGRLLMVPLPGHTRGHAGLLVDGSLLLAGDASVTPGGLKALRAHDPALEPLEYA